MARDKMYWDVFGGNELIVKCERWNRPGKIRRVVLRVLIGSIFRAEIAE